MSLRTILYALGLAIWFIAGSSDLLAAPLVLDNFAGPVANANGQLPTIGTSPWGCTGPGAANCIRGGGQLTATSGSDTIYYFMHTASTPLQVSYQFTDSVEAPTFVIGVTRNGQLNDMWHANGFNSGGAFNFAQTYWCDTDAGCPSAEANISPASTGANNGPCTATVPKHSYIGTLRFSGTTALAAIQDVSTGALLCYNVDSDPKIPSLIGPSFFLETYYASPNVAFNSVQAAASPPSLLSDLVQSSSRNIKAVAGALDAASIVNASFGAVAGLPQNQLPDALAQLSGEVASMSAGVAASMSTAFMDLLVNSDGSSEGDVLKSSRSRSALAAQRNKGEKKFDAWMSVYGNENHISSDVVGGAHGETNTQEGLALGLDYRPTENLVIGAAIGEARTDWSPHYLASSGHADVTQGGIYASKEGSRAYWNIGFAYSALKMSTQRFVTLGAPNEYDAGFNGADADARAELGLGIFRIGRNWIAAFAAIDGQRFTAPSYGEKTVSGDSTYALAVENPDKNQVFNDLGLRLDSLAWYEGNITVEGGLAWRHLYSPSQTATAQFLSVPGSAFTVAGSSFARDAAIASFGADMRLNNTLAFSATFKGAYGANSIAFGGEAMLRQSL